MRHEYSVRVHPANDNYSGIVSLVTDVDVDKLSASDRRWFDLIVRRFEEYAELKRLKATLPVTPT